MNDSEKLDLTKFVANTGQSLDELSRESPVLVVFLRHAGCAFCRETLATLQERREEIEASGVQIVLAHMIEDDDAAEVFFARYRLHDVPRIQDPQQDVYRQFGLKRGTLTEVMGIGLWWSGFKSIFLRGHVPGVPRGDIFQLPGAFLVADGNIVREFKSRSSIDHPDYVDFVEDCNQGAGC